MLIWHRTSRPWYFSYFKFFLIRIVTWSARLSLLKLVFSCSKRFAFSSARWSSFRSLRHSSISADIFSSTFVMSIPAALRFFSWKLSVGVFFGKINLLKHRVNFWSSGHVVSENGRHLPSNHFSYKLFLCDLISVKRVLIQPPARSVSRSTGAGHHSNQGWSLSGPGYNHCDEIILLD